MDDERRRKKQAAQRLARALNPEKHRTESRLAMQKHRASAPGYIPQAQRSQRATVRQLWLALADICRRTDKALQREEREAIRFSLSLPPWQKVLPTGRRECCNCHLYLPETVEFFRRTPGGFSSVCRTCRPRTEAQREHRRQWRKENPEIERARKHAQDLRHPEHKRLKQRMHDQRRRTRKLSLPNHFTAHDWRAALDHFNGCCAVCGRPPGLWHTLAMDHWIPLADKQHCPGTVPGNIVPLCHGDGGCNNAKHDHPAHEWLISTYGPRKAVLIERRVEAWLSIATAEKEAA